ncbi:hypothetical protein BSKO_00388 [Bryopsis sp. KO-2023]|nr:hypothetical protein BSKO_00388 [Bryopsis sp. KO-2023]
MVKQHKRWLPLESNPEVMNDFAAKLGLNTSAVAFCDVFGLDEDLLAMVPQPVLAVLLLFPITEESEKAKNEEEARISRDGQEVSSNLYYMKQTIGNACGTIGVLHAVCNNSEKLPVVPGSFFSDFITATSGMTAEERGKYLEDPPEGAPDIEDAHKEAASAGDTAPPSLDEVPDLHFVCFVEKDGGLYELDGRKASAIFHGPATPETLLQDSIRAVRSFMERTNSIQFNIIALAAAQQ